MRLVDRPNHAPHRCAAKINIGQTAEGMRWVDCGVEMSGWDNHVYLSEAAVVEAASVLGLPSPKEHAALAQELHDALQDNLKLLDRLAVLEKYEAAVDELQEQLAAA